MKLEVRSHEIRSLNELPGLPYYVHVGVSVYFNAKTRNVTVCNKCLRRPLKLNFDSLVRH